MNNLTITLHQDQDFSAIGQVVCVSELSIRNCEETVSAPVLVADNALVFFAWQEEIA